MFKTDVYPRLVEESNKAQSRADEVWAQDKEIASFNLDNAKKSQQRYEENAIPALNKLKADADLYNTAGYQEQMAGQAIGDIDAAQETARHPSSGRSAGVSNANNVQVALAKASAATQTREAAKALGLQKQANIYSLSAGLPMQSLQQSGAATSTAGAGMTAGAMAANTVSNAGAGINSATGTAMSGWNQVGGLGVGKYNADIAKYNADAQSTAGLGKALGSLGGAAISSGGWGGLFTMSDIRTKQNIKQLGVLDNGLSVYAFQYKPEFRDDWGHGIHIGVMAHEVEAKLPSAVTTLSNGYKAVDYSKVVNHGI
jgi:hypothetical protein